MKLFRFQLWNLTVILSFMIFSLNSCYASFCFWKLIYSNYNGCVNAITKFWFDAIRQFVDTSILVFLLFLSITVTCCTKELFCTAILRKHCAEIKCGQGFSCTAFKKPPRAAIITHSHVYIMCNALRFWYYKPSYPVDFHTVLDRLRQL